MNQLERNIEKLIINSIHEDVEFAKDFLVQIGINPEIVAEFGKEMKWKLFKS